MKRILFLLLTAFIGISSLSAHSIKGRVFDEKGEGLEGVTVMIETLNRGEISDNDGKFRFVGVHKGTYIIKAKMLGYETNTQEVKLGEDTEVFVRIHMVPNTELSEIEVFGERYKQPEKLDAITRMPLRPSEQIQSISVISEKVIAEQGALTVTDVVRNVPGVTLFGSYGGVSESMSTRGYRGVPILKNGVRVDSDFRTAAISSDMQGVESVQVIKGSAAITQGVGNDLGSPGGVINVVTKTPKFVNGGQVGFRVGSWGQVRPTFDVQSVLDAKRTVAFRLNGAYERKDGFKRVTPSSRVYINPSLEWRPDEKTTVTLELDYLDANTTPDVGTVNLSSNDTYALYKDAKNKYFGFDTDNSNNKTLTYAGRITRQLADKLSLRAAYFSSSYQIDDMSSGINNSLKDEAGDPIYNKRARYFGRGLTDDKNSTFQLDFVGKDVYTGSVKHTFQVGFDYKKSETEYINFVADETIAVKDPITGETLTTVSETTSIYVDDIDVYAPNINNEMIMPTLKANGREYSNWRRGAATGNNTSSYGLMLQEVMTINDYAKTILGVRYSAGTSSDYTKEGIVRNDAWNPMAGVMVSPMKNINLFGSFTTTTSLRSAANLMEDGGRIGASTSRQWEAGVKSDWLNDRLRFNFTYFYIMNNNLSNRAYDPETNKALTWFYKAGDLKRQGIETELSGRIMDNLQVMLGYAYLDAGYKNSPSYMENSAPMNAPKHTANGWVQYTLKTSVLKGLSIGVGTYYVGDRPVNEYSKKPDGHGTKPGEKPFDMPSYVTVNAQLGYTYGKVTARVFFNNIFDELGYSSYFRGGYINQIDPRNFAGAINYKF